MDSAAVAGEGRRVLAAMAEMGYAIEAKVEFRYDAKLRIMGYSRPLRAGYRVVAGKSAMQGHLLATLLAHELSHVHRMATGHPSHSNAAIEAAYAGLRLNGTQEDYHEEILHDVINNVQDLYADGIAFQTMEHMKAVPKDGLGGFFLAWMRAEAVPGQDARQTRWRLAHTMLGNARALAQIKSKGSAAQLRKALKINAELLHGLPANIAEAQSWFQDFYDNLPPNQDEADFTAALADYVQRFVAVAEGPGRRMKR